MPVEPTPTHTPPATALEPVSPLQEPHPLLLTEQGYTKVRELALRQLNRFISYEAKVLKGDDAEAIHDMRVASRRLQQVLDLLYAKPRPPELRRLRRQIRRCRRALGEVRNCDVLLDLVGRSLSRKRPTRRGAWTAVHQFLLVRRSETFVRAVRKLGKINLAVLYVNLKGLLHQGKTHDHSLEPSHRPEGPEQTSFANDLRKALAATWSGFEDHVAESLRHARPEAIHGARISAKRLRYLVEVLYEFKVEGTAETVSWLRRLQNHLGDWHDLEVLEQIMIEMVARPEFLRDHLPLAIDVERLILSNRERKAGFEKKYMGLAKESREMHRIKEWVSYLLASPSAAFTRG